MSASAEEKDVFKRDVLYVRAFLFLWVLVTLGVLIFVAAVPIRNMLFIYQRYDGTSVDNTYGLGWWPQTLFFVVNYLVILILCSIVADPDSPARVDLHQLASYIAIVGNGVIFFAFLMAYLFLVNSSLAGSLPYNDYRWCCVYHTDAPQYCPNTAMCDLTPTLLGSDLRVNFEFKIIWIFSIVFFSFATANRVFNLMLRETGAVVPPNKKEWEGYTLAILTVLGNVGFYCYWAGWPLKNTLHVHGYPTLGIPPGPGEFISTRYNYPWIALCILGLNIISPILFFVALAYRKTQFWHMTQFWFTIIINIISAAVLLFLVWLLIPFVGYCNFFNSAGSICNDYRWCCNYFADAPKYCNNVGPCPGVGFLLPNGEYVAHIYMALIFCIYNGVLVWLNYRMKDYGIFMVAKNSEE